MGERMISEIKPNGGLIFDNLGGNCGNGCGGCGGGCAL